MHLYMYTAEISIWKTHTEVEKSLEIPLNYVIVESSIFSIS